MVSKQKNIKIKSSDHFQLLFDYKIKKEGGTSNTSQLLVELDGKIDKGFLHDYLMSNQYFKQLVETSIVRPWIGKERYSFSNDNTLNIKELERSSLDMNEVFQNDDIGNDSVKVTLIHVNDKSSILFQFNHVFIDNGGVKNLLKSFDGEEFDFLRQTPLIESSLLKRIGISVKLAKQLLRKWYEPKAFIHSKSDGPIVKRYRLYEYNIEDTKRMLSKVKRSYHIASISSYLMSALSLAIKGLLQDRKEPLREFVFQQPYSLAPKRKKAFILGNRFSFLLYRLPASQVEDIDVMQDELNFQTSEQMKNKIPQKFLELESIMGLFPMRFHLWMASLPAKGKMTTFAYTFVGETKMVDEFAGLKVLNMINKPPIMRMPPITFGFGFYEDRMRFHICYDAETISEEEIDTLYERANALFLS